MRQRLDSPSLRRLTALSVLAAMIIETGCLRSGSSSMTPDAGLLEQSAPYLYSDADWADLLQHHVRDGLVNYAELRKDPAPLKRYYALLSRTGPSSTPDQFTSRQQSTAYWINAYNALILLVVLKHYPISTIYDLSLPAVDYGYSFTIDGRPRTLNEIEDRALEASSQDVRVLFAMCGGAMGCPRLADQPIRSGSLDRQLTQAAASALDDLAILQIDHASQSVLIWQGIFNRQGVFLDYWRSRRRSERAVLLDVLADLASPDQHKALQAAVGYSIRQLPFDRTLNDALVASTEPATEHD